MPNTSIRTAASLVAIFRRLADDAPLRTFDTFLAVAANPGISMSKLQHNLKMDQSATSRQITYLMKWRKPDIAGLDLVETVDDPADRRSKNVYLTPKGEALRQEMSR